MTVGTDAATGGLHIVAIGLCLKGRLGIFSSIPVKKGKLLESRHQLSLIRLLAVNALLTIAMAPAVAEQLNIRHYDTREGIPQVQVSSLHQDAEGYIWVGTFGGLARYNGDTFQRFDSEHGLSSSYVNVLDSDSEDRLWVGTARGVCRLAGDAFECPEVPGYESIMVNDILPLVDQLWIAADEGLFQWREDKIGRRSIEQGKASSAVLSLAIDAHSRLWVGTSSGVLIEDRGGKQFTPMPDLSDSVFSLEADGNVMWVGTGSGLASVDIVTRELHSVALPGESEGQINDLHISPDGVLWAAGVLGLFRIESDRVRRFTTVDGLRTNITHQTLIDREGLTWVATDQGLSKILPGPFAGYTADSGLLDSFVRTISEDPERRLWLGTRQGIQVVPHRDGQWLFEESEYIRIQEGLPDNRIYSIVFSGQAQAYIATGSGVVLWQDDEGVVEIINRETGLPGDEVHALLIDSRDRLWMSTTRGTVWLEDGEIVTPEDPRLAGAFALRIREDDLGRLWFTTLRSGLLIAEPGAGVTQLKADSGLTDEMLWDSAPAGDGSMWVGSNGDGLFRVWPDGRIRQFTTDDGLANNAVWQLLRDDQERVWAYTNHGLSKYSDGNFVNYGALDGLLHLEGGATGAFQSSDGLLWFASADGLMRYNPEREYHNETAPPVVIERVMLGDRAVNAGERLPHRAGNLEFHYAGLSFQDEVSMEFRYRLLGSDDQWSRPVVNRRVTFANLGYGDYVFEVTARNPHGVPSEEPARFAFSVQPPFWSTWWFIALAMVLIGSVIWLIVHLRVRGTEMARRELQATVRERTAELRDLNQRLREASRTDQLTGLPNRRYLFDRIGEDVARVHRFHHVSSDAVNSDMVFFMLDLDHFKVLNDRYGHDAGDRALKRFSEILVKQIRDSDYAVRWGGEEFLIVAGDSDAGHARKLAERLIRAVKRESFVIDESGTEVELTCSIGIAAFPFAASSPRALDWEQVVQIADAAVYDAKQAGRNCWVQFEFGQGEIGDGDELIREVKSRLDELVDSGRVRRRSGHG